MIMHSVHLLGSLALAGFLTALVLYTRDFWKNRSTYSSAARRSLVVSCFAHSALILVTLSESFLPSGRADFYLLLSFGVALSYLLVSRTVRFPILGAFATAATILFLASSSYLLHLAPSRPPALGVFFQALHVFPALFAELALVLAVVLSIVFRIQGRRLKRKDPISSIVMAPNLTTLERWMVQLLTIGFVTMSFSIASGSVWALFHQRSIFTADPAQWMGFLVWVLLAGIHLLRNVYGRSGGILARLTICAGVVMLSALSLFIWWGGALSHADRYLDGSYDGAGGTL